MILCTLGDVCVDTDDLDQFRIQPADETESMQLSRNVFHIVSLQQTVVKSRHIWCPVASRWGAGSVSHEGIHAIDQGMFSVCAGPLMEAPPTHALVARVAVAVQSLYIGQYNNRTLSMFVCDTSAAARMVPDLYPLKDIYG